MYLALVPRGISSCSCPKKRSPSSRAEKALVARGIFSAIPASAATAICTPSGVPRYAFVAVRALIWKRARRYSFRPWDGGKVFADGQSILDYVRSTASETGVDSHIRFNHRVTRADWDTTRHRWSVSALRADGTEATFDAAYVFFCTGYYRYDETYEPHFEGRDSFKGKIIRPQFWRSDYDYSGKEIVVIGSGVSPKCAAQIPVRFGAAGA